MGKRLTDRDIWDDPWFRKLPSPYKNMWKFICDKCDNAGFWKVDIESASFNIGEEVSYDVALRLFNEEKERIKVINKSEWFIPGFIPFQYGDLKDSCVPHRQVITLLEKHKIKIHNSEHKKEQDTEKEKELLYPNDIIRTQWERWTKHKWKELHFKYKTNESEQIAINEFVRLCNEDWSIAELLVNQAIANGWKGIYPLKYIPEEVLIDTIKWDGIISRVKQEEVEKFKSNFISLYGYEPELGKHYCYE